MDEKDQRHRRSMRLQNYDYAQPGAYFVTVCTQDREMMFGKIENDAMQLNSAGKHAESVWNTLPERFPGVELDEYVIMPNHVHGIITLLEITPYVPDISSQSKIPDRFKQHMYKIGAIEKNPTLKTPSSYSSDAKSHSPTLGAIIRTFKGASTRLIRTTGKSRFGWQQNYHEHIIRNNNDLGRIREYIANNPSRWTEDTLYRET